MSIQSTIVPIQSEVARIPEPQTRGFCLHLFRDLAPDGLREQIARIAAAGFNLIVFPIYSNGWTLFPSQAAQSLGFKSMHPLFRQWDPLEVAAEAASAHGLKVWAQARLYSFDPRHALVEHRLLRTHPRWRLRAHPSQQTPRTRAYEEHHACPVNRGYRRFLADLLSEAALRYPIDGLMLDYTGAGLRGGGLDSAPYCFCASCMLLYYQTFNADLADDARGNLLGRVRLWQLEQAHQSLAYIRHRLARTRRTLRLICRAAPDWRQSPDYQGPLAEGSILMDWPELLLEGIVEELAVDHGGVACASGFSSAVAADYAYLGDRVLFLPMASVERPDDLRRAVDLQNRLPIPGFIADFQTELTQEDALYLRERYLTESALLPESSPILTAAYLLDRVQRAHPNQPVLRDLLGDILRLLARQLPLPSDFALLGVLEDNLLGLESSIRRGRIGRADVSEPVLCDLGLARRFIRLACLDVRS